MNAFQALLLGTIYFVGNGNVLPASYYTVYRPIVAGFLTGLVLGDVSTGTQIGATINLMYVGFIAAGGSLPGDPCLAAVLGTALGITGGLDVNAALAVAVPVGLFGTILWFLRMTATSACVHLANKYVEKGETGKIWIANALIPQFALWVVCAGVCGLACYFGAAYVQPIIDALGGTVLGVLITIGGMMPALGIGLTMLFIFKGEARIFFFLGFLITVYAGLSLIQIGFIAICMAIIYMQLKPEMEGSEDE